MSTLKHSFNIESSLDLLESRANQPKIPAMTEIGKTIKARLKELGKTQGWLAEAAGVSNMAVSNWVKTGSIARENATIVADVLGITIDMLLNGARASEAARESRSDLVKLDPIQRRILALYSKADDRGKLDMLAALEEIAKDIEDSRRKPALSAPDQEAAKQKARQLGLVDPAPNARRKS
jgi:transcriptional regulator with XRE-family HTH domain